MRKHISKHMRKAGLPPGTVVYTGDKTFENLWASLARFSEDDFSEEEISDFRKVPALAGGRTFWITVNGVHHPEKVDTTSGSTATRARFTPSRSASSSSRTWSSPSPRAR